ncbi:hypothetical protein AVEN_162531-1 [Araneus ventricosus]|uniref:Uncharacterized protein n=1 Tax=Araneus ventricosus TaxID=182803 RepID=A0A4Y2I4Q2_ARAVE|nr:hypothetical protein AVEN_162531-1 [Araneus ventricosus]
MATSASKLRSDILQMEGMVKSCVKSAPTLSPARLALDSSVNVDEEAEEQWINEDSTLECCEVLSDDDIVSVVQKKQGISKNVLKVTRKIL